MKAIFLGILAVVLAVVLVSGCTQSTPPPSGNAVNIQNFAFNPSSITVSAGTAVTWTNLDATTHQIAADAGQTGVDGFSSPNMEQGSTYSYTFQTAGTYGYHCNIHPYMKGTVVVQ